MLDNNTWNHQIYQNELLLIETNAWNHLTESKQMI